MNILFLIPYVFVPPSSGNQNLTFNLLKYVTNYAVCDLVLLTEAGANEETIRAAIVAEFPAIRNTWIFTKPKEISLSRARLEAILQGYHPGIGRYKSKNLAEWLSSHLKNYAYDLVHFDMIHMAQYWKYCGSLPLLLVASDAYSNAARSAKLVTSNKIEKLQLSIYESLVRNYEKNEYKRFDTVCTVSETDRKYLSEIVPSLNVRRVGISIGEEYVREKPRSFVEQPESQPSILCTGLISCPPVAEAVLDFLETAYPEIIKRVPDVSLTLLGRNPTKKLKKRIQDFSSIKHIDYVPDYLSFLKKDWVYLYPQRASSGLQTKVQQAIALGLPVVGFEQAFGGLNVESGQHCFICQNLNEVSQYITDLLINQSLRQKIGMAGADHIRGLFSIDEIGEKIMNIYQNTIQLNSLGKK
jgi:glycosyltransferase involved in cell wall biosynthesis